MKSSNRIFHALSRGIGGIVLFLSCNQFFKHLTGDFSKEFLTKPLPDSQAHKEYVALQDVTGLEDLFLQEYTYLGQGNQAFVFLSQDQKHVLKLFRPVIPNVKFSFLGRTWKVHPSRLPLIKPLAAFFYQKQQQEEREMAFLSFYNAATLLREDTQVEYLHLVKTCGLFPQKTLKIYDKIGVLHEIELDKTSFLIQKKTDPLYSILARLVEEGKRKQVQELLHHFVLYCFRLLEVGVKEPTTLKKNLGCTGLKPVQMDVGKVFILPDSAISLEQVHRLTKPMKKWLALHDPSYLEYFSQQEMAEWSRYGTH